MDKRLQTRVDALGRDLARADEPTRTAVLERLGIVAARREGRTDAARRAAEEAAEAMFDNLPV
ncbi:hypothetical protein [Roseivivax isoporae]|uniref:Uncharacterized protein n=1 Tax=Roseivivax isoporae LMG 25204 TaxID=1449351 RepID=X7F3K0_9RHOB|nr:hypothetical protein [Roseivivax isoporae]ETX26676.1 hypothetical protein RISW2_20730 [Roseivivax isoporae LMG 25204]